MVEVKTSAQIEKMRVAGRLTGKVVEAVGEIIQPGITTMEIDAFCENYITNVLGAIPGSKGQYGYPYTVNTSVNHVICHGMPSSSQVLKDGDIVNVDITVIHDGFYGDSSKMFCVGNVKNHAKRLVNVTQECLFLGISEVKPGATLGDVGCAIQEHAERNNYSVVQEYCGHGIGQQMHEAPQVMHFGKRGTGLLLKEGMTFTIEPMINQGKAAIKHVKKGDWTIALTKDRRLSAQWEHTILVTETGFEILTLREEEKKMNFFARKKG
ncbi:MAG: methionine aminopeptidase [marine bacterium B5-7]|nr:MAG: methionine aminopeptidase [marine bacterium B5-7]